MAYTSRENDSCQAIVTKGGALRKDQRLSREFALRQHVEGRSLRSERRWPGAGLNQLFKIFDSQWRISAPARVPPLAYLSQNQPDAVCQPWEAASPSGQNLKNKRSLHYGAGRLPIW